MAEYFFSFDRMPVVPILGYSDLAPLGLATFECFADPEKHAKPCRYIVERFEIEEAVYIAPDSMLFFSEDDFRKTWWWKSLRKWEETLFQHGMRHTGSSSGGKHSGV